MARIFLKNGEIVTGEGVFHKDLLIENGKILQILDPGKSFKSFQEVDCTGKMILPGLIDAHVHLREPGHGYKEDWMTGSKAACAGGVTTVLDMPNNTPPICSLKDLEAKRKLIKGRSYVNYGLYMAFNGSNVAEINKVKNIPGVKFYACDSTGNLGVTDEKKVKELFEKSEKMIVVHAEDHEIVSKNAEAYLSEFGDRKIDPAVHSKIRSREAALSAVKKVCELAVKSKVPVHIAHVSTEDELEVINKYKNDGVIITCEVAPHHLILSDDDYEFLGNFIKVNPPVRERSDIFALWKALKFGEIDIIATDHAPHTLVEKEQDYREAPSGVPELDTWLAIMLNTVNSEGMDLPEVVRLCCEGPARIFGIKNKGKIEEGYDADLVVVDMDLEKKVENGKLFTKCGWSPYDGSVFKGWGVMTLVNGEIVFKDGKIVGKVVGQEAKFGK